MKSSNRPQACTDVSDAPYRLNPLKAPALLRVPGNKDYLVDNLFERIDQAFNECPALVGKKIFLLPVCTTGLASHKDDCRSHCGAPFIFLSGLVLSCRQEYLADIQRGAL
jgi:hypothetical protein